MRKGLSVIVNRPGRFSHLLQAEIVQQVLSNPETYEVRAVEYFTNAQSFKFTSDKIEVAAADLIEVNDPNLERINKLKDEAREQSHV